MRLTAPPSFFAATFVVASALAGPKIMPTAQAAAAAPSPAATAITATCSLGDHPGIEEAEARTGADVICHELARQHAPAGEHEVRFGVLGGRTLVILASRSGDRYDERRAFLTGMDELHVASPRLVSALVEGKEIEQTRDVDNVLSAETRQAKVLNGTMGFEGGLFGTTGIGSSSVPTAGIALGLLYRTASFGASASGRAGGIGNGVRTLAPLSLDVGARYYFSSSDVSPFVGGGFEISRFALERNDAADVSGSGFGAYVHAGLELLRTHHAGFSASIRLDAPFYALRDGSNSVYVMPLSFDIGLLFH